jgi:type IV fimbrial biogenesis protein FimT
MKRQSGFTLIELIVVLTISAIFLGLAIPAFREFTASQRVKNAAFDFAAAMLLARSEAVKRNGSVTVTPAAGGWANGWTVASGMTTLATQDGLTTVTITTNPDPTASISFLANGRTASNITFQFGTANTTAVRCVTVKSDGVTNTTTTSCPT